MNLTTRIKAGILALLMGFVFVAGAALVATSPVYATGGNDEPKKVYVCKYVGTPGTDERLQTGQNPIEVSVNAIQHNDWDGTVPGWFSDAHDRSYVLGYVPMTPEPTASSCPPGDSNPQNWTYTVTCEGVSGNRPNTDSVDANIRIKNLITGEVRTFNYHGPDNGPSGPFTYTLANFGVTWTYFQIQWVQVNGTNYHWEGTLTCGDEPEESESPSETPTPTDEPSETPTETVTVTPEPTATATVTVTAEPSNPTETVTVTPPVETETVTLPPVTVTVTETPTVSATETVTAPAVTETATVTETPTVTVTETVTGEPTATATETITQGVGTPTATTTVTVTDEETVHVTEYETDEDIVYSFDELPNTGVEWGVLLAAGLGVIALVTGLALLFKRK